MFFQFCLDSIFGEVYTVSEDTSRRSKLSIMYCDAKICASRIIIQSKSYIEASGFTAIDNTSAGCYSIKSTMEKYAVQSNAIRASIQKQIIKTDECYFRGSTIGRGMCELENPIFKRRFFCFDREFV